jgi:DNA-binding response OmpR family regulator
MNPNCDLQAIVVSSDTAVLGSISSCLGEMGINATIHRETSSAMQALTRQKTDALFVDRELDPEFSVLQGMRSSSSSRGAVAFAIVSRQSPANGAFRVADFVIDKPLAAPRVNRAVRAAYGIMLKERMQYFRHSLRTSATLVDASQRTFAAQTINISQTGIALESDALVAREIVQLKFCLPENQSPLSCKGQIIWSGDKGKAGLTFTHMSNPDKAKLKTWIENEFHREWHDFASAGTAPKIAHASA